MAYTSKLNSIIGRLRTLIVGVTGIDSAQVSDGRRDLYDAATWEALGWDATSSRPSGWYVERIESTPQELDGTGTSYLELRDHRIQIVGWLGVADPQTGTSASSSSKWRTIVEGVCTAIREDLWTSASLGGYAQGGESPAVVADEMIEVEGVTVHRVEIEMTATERIVWT